MEKLDGGAFSLIARHLDGRDAANLAALSRRMNALVGADAHCQLVRRERVIWCGSNAEHVVRALRAPVRHTHPEYVPSSGYSAWFVMLVTLLWYKHGFNLPYFCRLRGMSTKETGIYSAFGMPCDEGVQGYTDGFGNVVLLDDAYTYKYTPGRYESARFLRRALEFGPLLEEAFPGTFSWRFVTNDVWQLPFVRIPHCKRTVHRSAHVVLIFRASDAVYLPCRATEKSLSAFDVPINSHVQAKRKKKKLKLHPYVDATYSAPDCLELTLVKRIEAQLEK